MGFILLIISLLFHYQGFDSTHTAIRAAIDIGSGSTKLRVALIDLDHNKIIRILENKQIAVPYQEVLSKSPDHTFTDEVMKQGLAAIQELKAAAMRDQATRVVAIATAAFRKAGNGEAFIDQIRRETGVKAYLIDQDREGELGFLAVEAVYDIDPSEMVVWDIGGGSLQLTAKEKRWFVYRGHMASSTFKDLVIEKVLKEDPLKTTTPNPLGQENAQKAKLLAKEQANQVDAYFKEKIKNPKTEVIAIGSTFNHQIQPAVEKSQFTGKDIDQAVKKYADKTDKEMPGDAYNDAFETGLILVSGYVEELQMAHVTILDVNNADGALFFPDYWQ